MINPELFCSAFVFVGWMTACLVAFIAIVQFRNSVVDVLRYLQSRDAGRKP